MKSGGLGWWRNYFRTANSDIFDIIENAITVAASDCPKEFSLRRDRIAEKLFTCTLTRCSGCDQIDPTGGPGKEEDEGCKSGFDRDAYELEGGGNKGSKVNSNRDDNTEMNMNQISSFSSGEAEALTDEIEEEGQIVGEVYRIKELLQNCEDQSDSVLFESLRRLQLMVLTVDILKGTEIGKAVNGLRKRGSNDIRHLARTLIEEWKIMVDDWVNATTAITAEGTPDSVNPSVLDEEEGLPSPPLDDGLFFATQPTSMELSQFFDGMDDDGNPQNSGEFIKNHENGRKPSVEKQTVLRKKPPFPNEGNVLANDNKGRQLKRQVLKLKKPSNTESGPRRPQKSVLEQKLTYEAKYQQKQEMVTTIQKKPLPGRQDNKCKDEDAVQMKLEASKRKLHERYQQAENAKKQRTIQVMELQDLPKQGLGHRNPHMKPGNHNRHWTNVRR